ncbi:MAG: NapC/NirT family cytochrome c [Roseibium sp.]
MAEANEDPRKSPPGRLRRYYEKLVRPSTAIVGVVLAFGFVGGLVFWGGFNTVLDYTNSEQFCISCHTMRDNTYVEYQDSIHYTNRSGVRATCSDCHVPHEWSAKLMRKVGAVKDVWGQITGRVNTPEKFEAHRLEMAQREWSRFRRDSSLACRNCHDTSFFDTAVQSEPAAYMHTYMKQQGGFTCIDCHKGIAHKLPVIQAFEKVAPDKLVAEAEARRSAVRSYLHDK